MVAILGYSRPQIFAAIKDMYTAVANNPTMPFHFPVGAEACRALGYPEAQLQPLPPPVLESFAGVGYPFHANVIQTGDTVLDIGAGAGNDSLIAAQLCGSEGRVYALDLTDAMTRKLKHWAESNWAESTRVNLEVLQGSAEQLPLANESVDVITSNGMLNLVPNKLRALAEMARVLRPGGHLQMADVVIERPVNVDCSEDPRLWVECVVGAMVDEDLVAQLGDVGFEDIRILRRQDYFSHSPSVQTREIAAGFGAHSMEISARRGDQPPSHWRQWLRQWHPRRCLNAITRRGFLGTAGLLLALLACYGTLVAIGLLGVLGIGLTMNNTLWAGTIAAFTILAASATATGIRRHGSPLPAILALSGAGLVCYALFVDYRVLMEASGFTLLAGAVGWDLYLRRRREAATLGLRTRS